MAGEVVVGVREVEGIDVGGVLAIVAVAIEAGNMDGSRCHGYGDL